MVSVNTKAVTFTNGTANDATQVDSEMTRLFSNDSTLATAVTNIESNALTIAGQKTFDDGILTDTIGEETSANGVDVDGVLCKDGYANVAVTADPSSPVNGDIWSNTASNALKARINGITETLATQTYVTSSAAVPNNYISGKHPTYNSAASIDIPTFYGKDSGNTTLIDITSSKNVSFATSGLNGLATDATEAADTWYYVYAITDSLSATQTPGYMLSPKNLAGGTTPTGLPNDTSANLTGTVSTTSGVDTITGASTTFTSDYVVGQSIEVNTGDTLEIQSVDSDTQMTATANASTTVSGQTHKRVSPYDKYRQLPIAIRNDGSSNIIPFYVSEGWPHSPKIIYRVDFPTIYETVGPTNVLDNGSATTGTTVGLSSYVPPISTTSVLKASFDSASSRYLNFYATGSSNEQIEFFTGASSRFIDSIFPLRTDSSQQVDYLWDGASAFLDLAVMGYVVTEM